MNGVKQILFVQVHVDAKTYNRLMRAASGVGASTYQITTPLLDVSKKEYEKKLDEPNEFLRVKHKEYYADYKIAGSVIKTQIITIVLGDLLDSNRKHYINPKAK